MISQTNQASVDIDLENAAISTTDPMEDGLSVSSFADEGDVEIDIRGGSVVTAGQSGHGFDLWREGKGAVTVDFRDAALTTTGPLSRVFQLLHRDDVSTVIRLEDSVLKATGFKGMGVFFNHSSEGAGTVNAVLRDTTVTTSATGRSSEAYGLRFALEGPGGGDITLDMQGGGITTAAASSHAIFADILHGKGGIDVDLENVAITTAGASAHGIYAENKANGENRESHGDIEVEVRGASTITTAGARSHGIVAKHDGKGNIDIRAGGAITTAGSTAYAADVEHTGTGNVAVAVQDAAIETKGDYARVVDVWHSGTGAVSVTAQNITFQGTGDYTPAFELLHTGTGNVVITLQNAVLEMTSADSRGIAAEHYGTGSVEAILRDSTITVSGDGAPHGVRLLRTVRLQPTITGGDLRIDMQGGGVTMTSASSRAIFAHDNFGDGLIDIDVENAAIKTTGDAEAHAIFGWKSEGSTQGDIEIDVSGGSVETEGAGSIGIIGEHSGAGDVSIDVQGGSVRTQGADASAIYAALRGAGEVDVDVQGGSVTTAGAGAHGVSVLRSGGAGGAAINVQDARIRTEGDNSHAIFGEASGAVGMRADVQGGSLGTAGVGSSAVAAAHSGAGDLAIASREAALETAGAAAHGVEISHTGEAGAAAVEVQGGSVATAGAGAHGVSVLRSGGAGGAAINVQDARIRTEGDSAHPIFGEASGAVGMRVDVQGGALEATGANAYAIYAMHQGSGMVDAVLRDTTIAAFRGVWITHEGAGGVSVDVQDSAIETASANAYAIYAALGGAGNVGVVLRGSAIETADVGSSGIIAVHSDAGDVAIDVQGGSVETAGDLATAIYAAHRGAGAAGIAAHDAAIKTRGAGAHGITAFHAGETGGVSIDLRGGSVETAGAGAHGVYVRHEGGAGAVMVLIDSGASVRAAGAGASGVRLDAPNADAVAVEGAAAMGDDGYRQQSVVVNGDVVGGSGAGAGVYLAGGGRVTINPTGSVRATSGVAIHAAGAGSDLLLELNLDGRSVEEALYDSVVRNEGGGTTIFVNGVKLHDAKTGGTGVTIRNGLYNIELAEGATIVGREFSFADFIQKFAFPVPVYQSVPDALLRMAEGLGGERVSSPGSPVWARVSRGKGSHAMDGEKSDTEYDLKRDEAEAGLRFSLPFVKGLSGTVSVLHADASADVKAGEGSGDFEVDGLGLGVGLSYRSGGYYLDGRFSVMSYDVELASNLAGDLGDTDAKSHSFGVEAGRRFALGGGFSLTPRAWLVRTMVSVDGLTDSTESRISIDDATRMQVGGGVAAEFSRKLGEARAFSVRGSVDFGRMVDGEETEITIADETFQAAHEKNNLRLGLGGTYRWGRFTVEGAFFAGGVGSDDSAHSGRLTVGMRF